jgi:hypothetical protein
MTSRMAGGAPVRNVIAAVVGHVLEFYDFTIFASLLGCSFRRTIVHRPAAGSLDLRYWRRCPPARRRCSVPLATATTAKSAITLTI